MDVFILPVTLVSMYKSQIVDPKTKQLALTPFMLHILDGMYDELFQLFPSLDGIMIRVGENYLPSVSNMIFFGRGSLSIFPLPTHSLPLLLLLSYPLVFAFYPHTRESTTIRATVL